MIELHISGPGWIVVGLVIGILLSAGYLLDFYDAKVKVLTKLRSIL